MALCRIVILMFDMNNVLQQAYVSILLYQYVMLKNMHV